MPKIAVKNGKLGSESPTLEKKGDYFPIDQIKSIYKGKISEYYL